MNKWIERIACALACSYKAMSVHSSVEKNAIKSQEGSRLGLVAASVSAVLYHAGPVAKMEKPKSLPVRGLPAEVCPMSSAAGVPQPTVTWFKDGQLLVGGDAHHISPDGSLLQVLQANLSSAGHYSCIAANAVGEKTKHIQLSVLGTSGACTVIVGAGGKENQARGSLQMHAAL